MANIPFKEASNKKQVVTCEHIRLFVREGDTIHTTDRNIYRVFHTGIAMHFLLKNPLPKHCDLNIELILMNSQHHFYTLYRRKFVINPRSQFEYKLESWPDAFQKLPFGNYSAALRINGAIVWKNNLMFYNS